MHNRVNDTVTVILYCLVRPLATICYCVIPWFERRDIRRIFLSFAPGTVTLYCVVKTGSNFDMILVNYVAMV